MAETCVPLLLSGCSEAQKAQQDSLKLPDFAGLQCPCAGGTALGTQVCSGLWRSVVGLFFCLLPLAISVAVAMAA